MQTNAVAEGKLLLSASIRCIPDADIAANRGAPHITPASVDHVSNKVFVRKLNGAQAVQFATREARPVDAPRCTNVNIAIDTAGTGNTETTWDRRLIEQLVCDSALHGYKYRHGYSTSITDPGLLDHYTRARQSPRVRV